MSFPGLVHFCFDRIGVLVNCKFVIGFDASGDLFEVTQFNFFFSGVRRA